MAGGDSIKLFQFIQKYYRAIGIHKPESNQVDRQSFNSINWFFFLNVIPMLIATTAFFLYKAESMFEYGLSVYYVFSLTFGEIFYVLPIWQTENLSKFIENCERFIEKSKQNYNDVTTLIDKIYHKY